MRITCHLVDILCDNSTGMNWKKSLKISQENTLIANKTFQSDNNYDSLPN